jgi:hypothetical protein
VAHIDSGLPSIGERWRWLIIVCCLCICLKTVVFFCCYASGVATSPDGNDVYTSHSLIPPWYDRILFSVCCTHHHMLTWIWLPYSGAWLGHVAGCITIVMQPAILERHDRSAIAFNIFSLVCHWYSLFSAYHHTWSLYVSHVIIKSLYDWSASTGKNTLWIDMLIQGAFCDRIFF